jgi:serine protease Do
MVRGKFFSLHGDTIVLSSLIYDLDMTADSGESMFKQLFRKADYYDSVLANKYHCQPILEEQ